MEYPQRKHPRLPHYDYSAAGSYFLTLCTRDKRCTLGAVGRDDLGAPQNAHHQSPFVDRLTGSAPIRRR